MTSCRWSALDSTRNWTRRRWGMTSSRKTWRRCVTVSLSQVCAFQTRTRSKSSLNLGQVICWAGFGGWGLVCHAKKEVRATGCYIEASFPIPMCGCEKQPTLTFFFFPRPNFPFTAQPLPVPRKVKQVIFIRAFIRCIYSVDTVNMKTD